jgi:histidine triad (HIT) family protein
MVVGLEVPHTHMHLIPIDSLADMDFKNAKAAPQDALATMATTLRAALTAAGHKAAQLA